MALDDAVEVDRGEPLAVASAQVATGGGKLGPVTEDEAAGKDVAGRQLGIDPALAVVRSQAVRPQEGSSPEQPSSEPSPAPPGPPPGPAAVPVAASPPSPESVAVPPGRTAPPRPGGPVAAGPSPIPADPSSVFEIGEGEEHAVAFSFFVQPTAYREPGTDNLILRFVDEAGERSRFGLQLWDDGSGGQRGLWASGEAMGGERFLAPVAEETWHEAVLYFQASSEDDGLYLLTLDGQPIDARAWVSLIDSGSGFARLEVGLFRDGEGIVDLSDVFFRPARLLVAP